MSFVIVVRRDVSLCFVVCCWRWLLSSVCNVLSLCVVFWLFDGRRCCLLSFC